MILDRSYFYSLEHYEYGEAFYGSFRSVYYRLGIEPLENVHWTPVEKRGEHFLRAYVWKGPRAYSETGEEEKEHRDFPYTSKGLEAAVMWIDSRCEGAEELKLL